MISSQFTYQAENAEFRHLERPTTPFKRPVTDPQLRILLHRRAGEIHQRIRQIHARLKHNRERLLFDYILHNTLGRGKISDQIAKSQFQKGKQHYQTGEIIDFGCGLKSLNTIRKARQSLIEQGIIFEETQTDVSGASCPNRYGLVFIRDLLQLTKRKKRLQNLRQDTGRGYQALPPTIKSPSEITLQRCGTTRKKKLKRNYMDPAHVDYLINQMEQVTGDRHSRGAFAQLALTVEEGKLMELLSILKDRDNIHNRGAWLLAVARGYRQGQIMRADAPEPPEQAQAAIPRHVSLTQKLLEQKPQLAHLLDMNRTLQNPAVHQRWLSGT